LNPLTRPRENSGVAVNKDTVYRKMTISNSAVVDEDDQVRTGLTVSTSSKGKFEVDVTGSIHSGWSDAKDMESADAILVQNPEYKHLADFLARHIDGTFSAHQYKSLSLFVKDVIDSRGEQVPKTSTITSNSAIADGLRRIIGATASEGVAMDDIVRGLYEHFKAEVKIGIAAEESDKLNIWQSALLPLSSLDERKVVAPVDLVHDRGGVYPVPTRPEMLATSSFIDVSGYNEVKGKVEEKGNLGEEVIDHLFDAPLTDQINVVPIALHSGNSIEYVIIGSSDSDNLQAIAPEYLQHFIKKYSDTSFFADRGGDPNAPIYVHSGAKRVGIIMPVVAPSMGSKADLESVVGNMPDQKDDQESVPADETYEETYQERITRLRNTIDLQAQASVIAEFGAAATIGLRENVRDDDHFLGGSVKNKLTEAKVEAALDVAQKALEEDIKRYEELRSQGIDALSDIDMGMTNSDSLSALKTALSLKTAHISYRRTVIFQAKEFLGQNTKDANPDQTIEQETTPEQNIKTLKAFMPNSQLQVVKSNLKGEEGEYFEEMLSQYATRVSTMHKTYEQDGKGDNAVCHLHYFCGDSDWYITERDMEDEQLQAYGFVILHGDTQMAELGYINIDELKSIAGMEVDLHFEPISLRQIKAQHGMLDPDTDPDKVKNNVTVTEDKAEESQQEDGIEVIYASPRGSLGEKVIPLKGVNATEKPSNATGGATIANHGSRLVSQGKKQKQNLDHYTITDEITRTAGFSPKARYEENVAAIKVLKELEEQNRGATDTEKAVLVKYNGWGGLANVFNQSYVADEEQKGWMDAARKELPTLLTDVEYESARESVNNAHFTSPEAIKSIWGAVERLGFKGGRVLEPSMGVGSFLGLAPQDIVGNSQFSGVEKDSISGRIAQTVYPDSKVYVQGYEETAFPDKYFDMAITNVPFGAYQVYDPKYTKHKLPIHDYFIVKTLDKLATNGVAAIITSSHTMDKLSPKARSLMAKRADLLGAVRLPDDSQKAQAGTSVTTDVLFFKRKEERPGYEAAPDWVESETKGFQRSWISGYESIENANINKYFINKPENILGNLILGRGQSGRSRLLVEPTGAPLGENLDKVFAETLPEIEEAVIVEDAKDDFLEQESTSFEPQEAKYFGEESEGSFIFDEDLGQVFQVLESGKTAVPLKLGKKPAQRVAGMIAVRDAMDTVFQVQKDCPEGSFGADEKLQDALRGLNKKYDEFIKKNGCLNDPVNRRLFREDPEFGRVMALELYDEEEKIAEKADVFSQRVIQLNTEIETVETPREGLVASLNMRGEVDIPYIASLCGKTCEEVIEFLHENQEIFYDQSSQKWEIAAKYLAGNVREKLEVAREALVFDERLTQNIKALEAVIPEDLTPSEIDAHLGSPWIPEEIIKSFVCELIGTPEGSGAAKNISIHYREIDSQWIVDGGYCLKNTPLAINTYGTERRPLQKILSDLLNQKTTRVFDKILIDGHEHSVLNEEATLAAQNKSDAVRQRFADYVWADEERTEKLVRTYNDRFNSYVDPVYDGSHLQFPGMSPTVSLRSHQKDAVWRGLQEGNLLLAHGVGSGKTMIKVALAMESKRLKKANKSLLLVPNHMLAQFDREARQLYPAGKILAVTKKDMKKDNRKQFMGKTANNDWDMVIMTHSMFETVALDPEFERRFTADELQKYREELVAINDLPGGGKKYGVKDIERRIKTLKNKLEKLKDQRKVDTGLYLDDMGVDAFLVDEFHTKYKNLAVTTGRGSELAQGITGSSRAWDMYMKSRWLYEHRGSISGMVYSSATPVSNNVLEIFNVQRYLQPDLLAKLGIENVAAWAGTFLAAKPPEWEPSATGTGYKLKTRYMYNNLPELMSLLRQTADVVTSEDIGLVLPEANRTDISADMSKHQKRYMEYLNMRVARLGEGGVDSSRDNILKILSECRKLAIDPRMLHSGFPDYEHSKVNKCVARAFNRYQKSSSSKGTQLLFLDMGVPNGKGFNVYADIRTKLVNKGVPEEEIAFIHDYPKDEDKDKLFAQVREGEVRFLLGSTSKMGEGTNVQDKIVGISDIDTPWRPSDIEQRAGRGIRQGNENETVDLDRYVTEGSSDHFIWNLLKYKAEAFSRIFSGKEKIRRFDMNIDPSYAETVAITSGNPLLKSKMEIDREIKRLEVVQKNQAENVWRARRDIRFKSKNHEEIQEKLEKYKLIPKATEDTGVWKLDLEPYGYKSKFEGGREKLLPLIAKLMNANEISRVDGITCGGVPVSVTRTIDTAQQRRYSTWHVGEKGQEVNFQQAAKIEEHFQHCDKRLKKMSTLIKQIENEIGQLKEVAEKPFEWGDKLKELYADQRKIGKQLHEAAEEERVSQAGIRKWGIEEIENDLLGYLMSEDSDDLEIDILGDPERYLIDNCNQKESVLVAQDAADPLAMLAMESDGPWP